MQKRLNGKSQIDKQGCLIARCVDDLTLVEDLDKTEKPKPGWYRIVSDDTRLLQLVMCQANANDPLNNILEPIASLFTTHPEQGLGGMVCVADHTGNPIAIAAPLPGERECPCELITPHIDANHFMGAMRFCEVGKLLRQGKKNKLSVFLNLFSSKNY